MEVFEAIEKRTSVRAFSSQPVARALLERLVDAGRRAPSGCNVQPVEYVVIIDVELKEKLAGITEYGKFIHEASACIAVISQNVKYYLEDGCAAVENILLAATGLGLASCWVAGDKKPYVMDILQLLHIPETYKLVALIAIGYAANPVSAREKRSLAEVLHWDTFHPSQS
jgi:nitroreductase